MNNINVDIISLIILIFGIIWMNNNTIYIKNIIYMFLIIALIDLRKILLNL
jgi:hypothetical protein